MLASPIKQPESTSKKRKPYLAPLIIGSSCWVAAYSPGFFLMRSIQVVLEETLEAIGLQPSRFPLSVYRSSLVE